MVRFADLTAEVEKLECVSGGESSCVTDSSSFSDVRKALTSTVTSVRQRVVKLNAQLQVAKAKQGLQAAVLSRVTSKFAAAVGLCSEQVGQQPAGGQSSGCGTASNNPDAPGGIAAAAAGYGGLLAAGQHTYIVPQAPRPISPRSLLSAWACDQEAAPSHLDAAHFSQGAAPSDQTGPIVDGLKQHIRCLYQATLAAPPRGPPLSAFSSLKPRIGLQLNEYKTEVCEQLEQQRMLELAKLQGMQQQGGSGMMVQAAALLQRGVISSADYAAALHGDPLLPSAGTRSRSRVWHRPGAWSNCPARTSSCTTLTSRVSPTHRHTVAMVFVA